MPSHRNRASIADPRREARREQLLRDLKLALVDQKVRTEGGGCNPYDAVQGEGRPDRWDLRRR